MRRSHWNLPAHLIGLFAAITAWPPSMGRAWSQDRIERLALSDSRRSELRQLLERAFDNSNSKCEVRVQGGSKWLTFEGSTDLLPSCLTTHRLGPNDTLQITSQGGITTPAIVAGMYIQKWRINVQIEGFCMSSCANYIAAAANTLSINSFSVLGLHGAPALASQEAENELRAQIMTTSQISDSDREKVLKASIDGLRKDSGMHQLAAMSLNVHSGWYDLTEMRKRHQLPLVRGAMVIPSRRNVLNCLKGVQFGTLWFPETAADREAIWELYPSSRTQFTFDEETSSAACSL
jgi:hypothetical protein